MAPASGAKGVWPECGGGSCRVRTTHHATVPQEKRMMRDTHPATPPTLELWAPRAGPSAGVARSSSFDRVFRRLHHPRSTDKQVCACHPLTKLAWAEYYCADHPDSANPGGSGKRSLRSLPLPPVAPVRSGSLARQFRGGHRISRDRTIRSRSLGGTRTASNTPDPSGMGRRDHERGRILRAGRRTASSPECTGGSA
jgi:hypothetical protein